MLTTTFNQLRENVQVGLWTEPRVPSSDTLGALSQELRLDPYIELRRAYGNTWPNDAEIPLFDMIRYCRYEVAVWSLQAVMPGQEAERDHVALLFIQDCVSRVLMHEEEIVARYEGDSNGLDGIQELMKIAKDFRDGRITESDLAEVNTAGLHAVWAGGWAIAYAKHEAVERARQIECMVKILGEGR